MNFRAPVWDIRTNFGHFNTFVNLLDSSAFAKYRDAIFGAQYLTMQGATMPRKIDQTAIDHLIIRRAMHNAAGEFEVYFSEFSATWHDPRTEKEVDFSGTMDSQISLKTARIHGSDKVYELKNVFTDAELRAFNYLINSEHTGRARAVA